MKNNQQLDNYKQILFYYLYKNMNMRTSKNAEIVIYSMYQCIKT